MKAFFIVNRRASGFEKIKPVLDAHQSTLALEVCECDSPEEVLPLVDKAVAGRFDVVVAGGGDGTIHDVVNALVDRNASLPLGIVPLGTGNDFSRSLDVPIEPEIALKRIIQADRSQLQNLDLIQVHGAGDKSAMCVNLASGGFAGVVGKNIDYDLKKKWGALAYARAAFSAASDVQVYNLTMAVDEGPPIAMQALNVVVANGKAAGGGFEVAPDASPSDRHLDLVVVHPGNAVQMAAIAARLAAGDYTQSELVTRLRAKTLRIESEPKMEFSVDGNLFGATPLEFKVVPHALQVVA